MRSERRKRHNSTTHRRSGPRRAYTQCACAYHNRGMNTSLGQRLHCQYSHQCRNISRHVLPSSLLRGMWSLRCVMLPFCISLLFRIQKDCIKVKIIIYGHQEIWFSRASGNDSRDWTNRRVFEVRFGLLVNSLEAHLFFSKVKRRTRLLG
jgi:hypothetical protein